jgi:DNA topoisomerase I
VSTKKKTLVIVESPAKSHTISKYLGDGFLVSATVGHIFDLPKEGMSIDISNQFHPFYEVIKGKEKVLSGLLQLAKQADEILLATDPDREGEAISFHLYEKLKKNNSKIYRVIFKEITKTEILSAIQNKRSIHIPTVDSQITRRIIDRLMGYTLSPLLWKNVKSGLSAGRVQSVVLYWICQREAEILSFVSKDYYTVKVHSQKKDISFSLVDPKTKEILKIETVEELDRFKKQLAVLEGKILSLKKPLDAKVVEKTSKEKLNYPPQPFTTSSLQQSAFSSLGFPSGKTMKLAQSLYEGVNAGEFGQTGLITYMRSDSTRISSQAAGQAGQFIQNKFGKEYLTQRGLQGSVTKGSQDAHEAIRPVNVLITPDKVKNTVSKDLHSLYTLIWKRFVASRMAPEKGINHEVIIECKNYFFIAKEREVTFPGYTILYEPNFVHTKSKLETIHKDDRIILDSIQIEKEKTKPPERYNDSSIVKKMETTGVGRPSTYSSIIELLISRNYIERIKKYLAPTESGNLVNDFLQAHFSIFIYEGFTSNVELELDKIAAEEARRLDVIQTFYESLSSAVKNFSTEKKSQPKNLCPLCKNGNLQDKLTRTGKKYKICSNYPECEYAEYY